MILKKKMVSLTITKQQDEKIINNNQKAARMRRQRGYQWEDTIVNALTVLKNGGVLD